MKILTKNGKALLANGKAVEYNMPTKGIVFTEYNNDGYPTKGKIVGMTSVPAYYCYKYPTYDGAIVTYLEEIELSNEITSIGECAFLNCTNLTSVKFPSGITTIGDSAFNKASLASITELPDSITTITQYAFRNSNIAITRIPNGVTRLNRYVFMDNPSITNITFHSSISQIYQSCFENCSSLTSVTFEGKPGINSTSFKNCPNLLNIYVPWNEGEVSNAPWGATNATIWYDCTHPVKLLDYLNNIYIVHTNTNTQTLNYRNLYDNEMILSATSSDPSVNVTATLNDTDKTITVTTTAGNVECISNINLSVTFKDGDTIIETFTRTCCCNVFETMPSSIIDVMHVANASYGFALNNSGYYESQNKGIASSAALCKIKVVGIQGDIYLDCINSGESSSDFGLISNIDTELSTSYSVDISTNLFKSFKDESSLSVKTITYSIPDSGEHYIYIKYRKDSSVNRGNDSFQFKIRTE